MRSEVVMVFLGGLLIFGCTDSLPPNQPNGTFVDKASLNETICEAAGGHWNECGSACRGAPEGSVCTLQCIQYCECGGFAGFRCPEDYYCTDYIPEYAADAVGICKPISLD
ncbi:MAG: hypothetical protein ABH842_06335 [Candidatus Micrarchaeota archaeon]